MTLARVGSVYVESTTTTATTTVRIGSLYVEALASPTTKARAASFYLEVVTGGPPTKPWGTGWMRL